MEIPVPPNGQQYVITNSELALYNEYVRTLDQETCTLGVIDNIYLDNNQRDDYQTVQTRVNLDPALYSKYPLTLVTESQTKNVMRALPTTRFWEVRPRDLAVIYMLMYSRRDDVPHKKQIWFTVLNSVTCHWYMVFYKYSQKLGDVTGHGKLALPRLFPPGVFPSHYRRVSRNMNTDTIWEERPDGTRRTTEWEQTRPSPWYTTLPEYKHSPNDQEPERNGDGTPKPDGNGEPGTDVPERPHRSLTLGDKALHSPKFNILKGNRTEGAGVISGFEDRLYKGEHMLDTNVLLLYPGTADNPQWSIAWRHSGHANARIIAFARYSVKTYSEATMLQAITHLTGASAVHVALYTITPVWAQFN